jgi:hypothetical protein
MFGPARLSTGLCLFSGWPTCWRGGALFQSAHHLYEKRREGSIAGSGSIHLTNGSWSGKPKNMRIRIPNTDNNNNKNKKNVWTCTSLHRSVSGRPKNMRIRIWLQLRIPNTDNNNNINNQNVWTCIALGLFSGWRTCWRGGARSAASASWS